MRLSPAQWAAEATGGPTSATIALSGDAQGMMALATWLAYRIEIVSDGTAVWWGEVDAVRVTTGGIEREMTLDGMANRVKVLYSTVVAGGGVEAAEIDWVEDATSIAKYGKRELVHSARGNMTATQAAAHDFRLKSGNNRTILAKPFNHCQLLPFLAVFSCRSLEIGRAHV